MKMFDTARIKIEEDLGVIDWKPNFKVTKVTTKILLMDRF